MSKSPIEERSTLFEKGLELGMSTKTEEQMVVYRALNGDISNFPD